MKSEKTVIAFKAESKGEKLEEILLNHSFQIPVKITDVKTTELRNVKYDTIHKVITGIFITTLMEGIPPAHIPGKDDCSAIPLKDGEGLAYPNTILYDINTQVMMIEYNRLGVSEKRICEYFKSLAVINKTDFELDLYPILKGEAYKRVMNMAIINSLECRIATPINLIKKYMKKESLANLAAIAETTKASKQINIILKAEEEEGGLSKKETCYWVKLFENISRSAGFNRRDNLKIKGLKKSLESEDGLIEEDVNFFFDKISGTFSIEEERVASSLQVYDRKHGIINVFHACKEEIQEIVEVHN